MNEIENPLTPLADLHDVINGEAVVADEPEVVVSDELAQETLDSCTEDDLEEAVFNVLEDFSEDELEEADSAPDVPTTPRDVGSPDHRTSRKQRKDRQHGR